MVEMLGPLPARPPTPPRAGSRLEQGQTDTPIALHTPGETHTANSFKAPPSSRSSKRVTFASHPTPAKDGRPRDSPFKSILKESNSPIPVWSPNTETFTSESLAMLLESVSQQLASGSVTSRLDAYMQFFGALRTYDGLPTVNDIKGKLSLITDYIQRDVARELVNSSPLDTNLVTQALKLSAAFVWHSDIAPSLSDDFKIFILDHALASLEDAKAPKSVLTHYMSILSTQDFGVRVLTHARITRLLHILKDLTDRVPGKAIVSSRLGIYQRILAQQKTHFISQSSLWVEHVVSGVLNHVKETRLKAIQLGFQVSLAAGPNNTVSKFIRDMFDRPLDNGQKLVTEIRERLSRMMAQPDAGVHVPQAWSVVVLLLRSKKWKWDQWEHFKEWVLILQKCFNCSEPAIKAQAILAWNRFVFAIGPDESTTQSLLKMLGRPIISQFDKKKSDKSAPPTPLALGSYHNLLYYSFRPSSSRQYLDVVWDEYIANPASSMFSTTPALSDNASRVLENMLSNSRGPRAWTENRIHDAKKIEPDELPPIDSLWVRSRVSIILPVFESLLKASIWDETDIPKSNISLAWVSLSNALSLASSKEITPSSESMQVVASILGFLCRLWTAGLPSLNVPAESGSEIFFERFKYLSTTMISSLGGILFDEILLLRTSEGTFQISNTPTHRKSTSSTNLSSPILHLLETIRTPGFCSSPTLSYTQLIEGLIEASSRSRSSRGSRLELLQQFSDLSSSPIQTTENVDLDAVLWKASARAAADTLQSIPIESARERDGSSSRDYESVTKILKAGLKFSDVHQDWSHLLGSFGRVLRTEKSDQALSGLMIEPMAKSLSAILIQNTYMPLASLLSHSLSISFWPEPTNPNDQSSIQQSMQLLPVNLLEAAGRTLQSSYDHFSVSETHGLAGFIESLTSFLGSGAVPFRATVLETLQQSLGPWVQDEKCKLDAQHGVDSRVLTACRALISAILNILQTSCSDLPSLEKFGPVICAGLCSPHSSRCKKFVDFWHSTAVGTGEDIRNSALGKSLQAAEAKLEEETIAQANSQAATTESTVPIVDNSTEPEFAPGVSRAGHQQYLNINSSPVIGQNNQPPVEPHVSAEPTLPNQTSSQVSEDSVGNDVSNIRRPPNHREMFRLIDSIHSSSPANTPGKLGFETPVHLRRFHAMSSHDAPLTPTLAAAENEDGFIGSSPTPATRDPTPASIAEHPVLIARDVAMADASDIPSSPPEINSNTPSPRKKSRRSKGKKKSSKERKALARIANVENGTSSNPISITDSFEKPRPESQDESDNSLSHSLDGNPPSRRTRSALSQSIDNVENVNHNEATKTPVNGSGEQEAPSSKPKSKSSSRKQRRQSRNQADENQQPAENVAETISHAADLMDSSSDDLEQQINSQLEQDLELVLGSHKQDTLSKKAPQFKSSEGIPNEKKRKRHDDSQPTKRNSRRRSTRLSTTNDIDMSGGDDVDATQSQEIDIAEDSQTAQAPSQHSITRRSTRGSQRNEDAAVIEQPILAPSSIEAAAPEPMKPAKGSNADENERAQELSQPPPKRSRKSLRSQEQSTPTATKETPAPTQLTPTTRSGKKRFRLQKAKRQVPSEGDSIRMESSVTDAANLPGQTAEDSIPGSFIPSEPYSDPGLPLVSTEEATDSHVTDMTPASGPMPNSSEMVMEVDLEPTSNPIQTSTPVGPVGTIAVGVQTEALSTSQQTSSKTSIISSLNNILENMKSANLSYTDLREVEDLLFNIRVQAQNATQHYNSA